MLLCRNELAFVKDATMDVPSQDPTAVAPHPTYRYLRYSDRDLQKLRWSYVKSLKCRIRQASINPGGNAQIGNFGHWELILSDLKARRLLKSKP